MNCELSATTVHGYFDGELDAVRAAEFEKHLADCAECQTCLRAMRSLREGLQRSNLYRPASPRLRAQLAQQLGGESPKERRRWNWLPIATFSAVAALLAISAVVVLTQRSSSARLQAELIDAHVRSLQPGHLMDVESTDQHTVKPWFDGKLEFIPPVTDFSQQGYPLLGGRLDVVEGHNVAALVYGRRKHVINLFIWPSGKEMLSAAGSQQGFNWLTWRSGDMQFSLVSDVSAGDLRELRSLLQH